MEAKKSSHEGTIHSVILGYLLFFSLHQSLYRSPQFLMSGFYNSLPSSFVILELKSRKQSFFEKSFIFCYRNCAPVLLI
jgi:hypothetical protein